MFYEGLEASHYCFIMEEVVQDFSAYMHVCAWSYMRTHGQSMHTHTCAYMRICVYACAWPLGVSDFFSYLECVPTSRLFS